MIKRHFLDNHTIAQIILARPEKHNAFDDVFIASFLQILEEIEHDPTVRVVMLCAEGPSFSAGADLHWMRKMAAYSEVENIQDAMQLATLMQRLNTLNKPTIACVQGNAFGGALGLIACCDIAIAAPQALFCFSEVKLGLIPAVISPYIIAAIGERMARRYFLTAESFSAQSALDMQLIHQISDDVQQAGIAFAQQLVQNGPQALQRIKQLIRAIAPLVIDKNIMKITANAIAEARVSAEGQERLTAFLDKHQQKTLEKK